MQKFSYIFDETTPHEDLYTILIDEAVRLSEDIKELVAGRNRGLVLLALGLRMGSDFSRGELNDALADLAQVAREAQFERLKEEAEEAESNSCYGEDITAEDIGTGVDDALTHLRELFARRRAA